MTTERLQCAAEPSSVRVARQFVVDKLQEWRCDELVDSAALMTSELATNAVVHTQRPYSVCVERRSGGIRVEVADSAQELPPRPEVVPAMGEARFAHHADHLQSFHGEPLDVNNLFTGLGMVDAMATRWGSETVPGNGKVVWFELAAPRDGGTRARVSDLSDLRGTAPAMGVASEAMPGTTGAARGTHRQPAPPTPVALDRGAVGPRRAGPGRISRS